MTPEGVTCARLRLAHVTPSGVTSKNPHTLYTITCLPTSEAESLTILNMGLPVERIMAEVEEEMLHMDEEVNGEPAEVEHMDELNEDLEKDLDGIAIEVVKGNKP